jgi:ATP-binding cassette subfamily F protein 3
LIELSTRLWPATSTPATTAQTGTLSQTQAPSTNGLSVVTPLPPNSRDNSDAHPSYTVTSLANGQEGPTTTAGESPYPPPFSSLYFPPEHNNDGDRHTDQHESPPAFAAAPPFTESSSSAVAVAATGAALPRDTKDGSSSKDLDDGEPPPPYSEGYSPLESFTYVMASAGGPASIITQVSQGGGGPPMNTLGGSDENITLELRYGLSTSAVCDG